MQSRLPPRPFKFFYEFAPERGQLYKLTAKELTAKESSKQKPRLTVVIPSPLKKGTRRSICDHCTELAQPMQIFIQTTIYYIPTENTVLSLSTLSNLFRTMVGIARTTQFFLFLPRENRFCAHTHVLGPVVARTE